MIQPRFPQTVQHVSVCLALTLCALLAHAAPSSAQSRRRTPAPQSAPSTANTEEVSGAPAGYERAITNALHEFELQNYAEARSGFREAHRLYPNARTFRALGMVEFELKNYAAAIAYLEQGLASQERRLSDAQRSGAEELLARARGYVGRYRVTLRPSNTRLLIDGQQPEQGGGGALMLSVGEHSLEAEAEGHRPLRRQLQVQGGEDQALDLMLMPLPPAKQNEGTKPDSPVASTPVYKKWWLWTTIGVVVAAGAATGLVLGLRKDEVGSASGGNTGTVLRLPPEMSNSR